MFGKGNIYLRIGDALANLLCDLAPVELARTPNNNKTTETNIQMAMLTIFQFAEELTNLQIAEALRNRVELKYALHLPMNTPQLDPNTLCEFRKYLFNNPPYQVIFQTLLDRTAEFGLFKNIQDQPVLTMPVLIAVCTATRIEEVVHAMHQALETLAVADPEWLRRVTLPYWYDRYNRGTRKVVLSFSDPKWHTRAMDIVNDIRYLLEVIDRLPDPNLGELPEIKRIRQIMGKQFLTCLYEPDQRGCFQRMVKQCNGCNLIISQ